MFARFDENPAMAYNRISIKPYIKSHLELQREITQIELAPSPYCFVESICLAYMNMFARFDENPVMTLRVIKKTKRYGRTDNVKTVYPLQTKFAGGIIICIPRELEYSDAFSKKPQVLFVYAKTICFVLHSVWLCLYCTCFIITTKLYETFS